MPKLVFISYARADASDFAKVMHEQLIHAGHDTFLDTESIIPTSNWPKTITEAIEHTDYVVAILTPGSVQSDACRSELLTARTQGKTIIPLLRIPCEIPEELQYTQYIDFTDDALFESKLGSLLYTITLLSSPSTTSTPWLDTPIRHFGVHHSRKYLYCITPNTTLADAYDLMHQSDFVFRHLMVTENGKAGSPLLGILSLRHILKLMGLEQNKDIRQYVAGKVMDQYHPDEQPDIWFTSVYDDEPLKTALTKFNILLERRAAAVRYFYMSAIPMIDRAKNATGIVSFKDILRTIPETFPIPKVTVIQVMRGLDKISYSLETESFADANMGLTLRGPGQRDIPIVENHATRRLLGFVPDHIFITNRNSGRSIGEFMVDYSRLRIQYPHTPLKQTIQQYLSGNAATVFYSFPVVNSDQDRTLMGLIGYRDIFQKLL